MGRILIGNVLGLHDTMTELATETCSLSIFEAGIRNQPDHGRSKNEQAGRKVDKPPDPNKPARHAQLFSDVLKGEYADLFAIFEE